MTKLYLLILFLTIGFLNVSCESQKKTPPYWLLALLNQENTGSASDGVSTPTPTTPGETPTESPDVKPKVYLTAEHIAPTNASETCQTFGGLLISFSTESKSTCTSTNLTSSCFSQFLEGRGIPKTLDPRTYVGFEMPVHEEVEIDFPRDDKSVLYCYERPKPESLASVGMYAYRDRSPHPSVNTCYQRMNGQHCRDTLNLSSPTSFSLPREFVIWTEDGGGNAGSHMLEVRYIKENGKFTTCTYGGNYYQQREGFTRNAYISGNVSEQYMRGYCIECSGGFCDNQVNSGNGPFSFDDSYLIPIGSTIVAKDYIYLAVLNGEGQKKHSVRWNIEGFSPLESNLDLTSLAGLIGGTNQTHYAWLLSGLIFLGLVLSIFLNRRKRFKR